jgi:hypothetical protein
MAICLFIGNLVQFPRFGILCQEKSGNPALEVCMAISSEVLQLIGGLMYGQLGVR